MSKKMAIARATAVIGSVGALAIGATLANLSSTASLTNNTVATATADLKIQVGDSGFGESQQGFTITGLVPGTESAPFFFDLQNAGGVPLDVTVNVPVEPTFSGFEAGGFSKVHLNFKHDGGTPIVSATLADLLAGDVVFNSLTASQTGNFQVTVTIDEDAVTGSSAQINDFELVFTGTQPGP